MKTRILSLGILLSAATLHAQTPITAPLPAQLSTAHTVFLANAGSNTDADSSYAYSSVYRKLEEWGGSPLATTPADADVLLELSVDAYVFAGAAPTGAPVWHLHLAIRDPKTDALLWVVNEPVQNAVLASSRSRNFDAAITKLIADLKVLSAGNATTTAAAVAAPVAESAPVAVATPVAPAAKTPAAATAQPAAAQLPAQQSAPAKQPATFRPE
jgi:hypothetical protein